jgi:hypothetical protein
MRRALLALPVACLLALAPATGATATGTYDSTYDHVYEANLKSLNSSGAGGKAWVTHHSDGRVTVEIISHGLAAGLVHAQHIHGGASGVFTCPTMAADTNSDGVLTVAEGAPFYGGILLSLTTSGDASPASGLAIDRMPSADLNSILLYKRTFAASQVPAGLVANLANLTIVQHGVDLNSNGEYDFDAAGASELDASLPQEATAPATCGAFKKISAVDYPVGGIETGSAGVAPGLLALGAIGAVLGSSLMIRRRNEA